jgi:hypothetical protein
VLGGLTVLLLAAVVARPRFRRWLATLDLRWLVAVHLTRFVGLYFLLLYYRDRALPRAFAVPGGWGDIIVATLALGLLLAGGKLDGRPRLVGAWNAFGLLDILFVVATASRLALADPDSMNALLRLPLSLLVTCLVPIIVADHIVVFWRIGAHARLRGFRGRSRRIAWMPRGSLRAERSVSGGQAFLEGQGYDVKGRSAAATSSRSGVTAAVIVERAFRPRPAQGVDRLTLTDRVYLAVGRPRGRRGRRGSVLRRDVRDLCRRLGLGLMTVAPGHSAGCVEVVVDPVPYRPRRRPASLTLLLGEHARRVGDPNRGGVTRTPIVTAYRQEALRCAMLIERGGHASLKALRESGLVPNAPRILQRDVYGWFRRLQRATYALTERARQDIGRFAASSALPGLVGGATMKD